MPCIRESSSSSLLLSPEAVRREPAHETAPRVRRVFLKELGGYSEIPLFDGATLRTGSTISGPALVQTRLTVALVPPSCQAHVTARGGLMIEVG